MKSTAALSPSAGPEDAYVAGYLIIPVHDQVPLSYGAGYSQYVAVWPIQSFYPGHDFNTGLPGTWMFAQYKKPIPANMYSDVEGGLGWWNDTQYPQLEPKFIMGGVGPNFSAIANGPYYGAGTWEDPKGKYGVIQVTPWLLFPPDGIDLAAGQHGQLLGYGYLNLPWLSPKPTTDGKPVPTGGNGWTLFLNAKNFRGPVAFFAPHFWAKASLGVPNSIGQLLDHRPADPNRAIQMETHFIPAKVAQDSSGTWYARIAPTRFPVNEKGESLLVTDVRSYNSTALQDEVARWFQGGPAPAGSLNATGSFDQPFGRNGYATWEIVIPGSNGAKDQKAPLDWSAFAQPTNFAGRSYGFKWLSDLATSSNGLETIPPYYRLAIGKDGKPVWQPIAVDQVPSNTGLTQVKWATPAEPPPTPLTTPFGSDPTWKYPGPVAGPLTAKLKDGSVLTYYWYKFEDQPAMLHAGLTQAERDQLQKKVEKMERKWKRNGISFAPPSLGTLASIDPALIVNPPKGMEVGYVPVVTRQSLPKVASGA